MTTALALRSIAGAAIENDDGPVGAGRNRRSAAINRSAGVDGQKYPVVGRNRAARGYPASLAIGDYHLHLWHTRRG